MATSTLSHHKHTKNEKEKEALQNIQTSPEPEGGDGQGGLFQRERLLHPPDLECLIITTKDRKPLSPAASRLHWMHMASDKPILPVVTASSLYNNQWHLQ